MASAADRSSATGEGIEVPIMASLLLRIHYCRVVSFLQVHHHLLIPLGSDGEAR
jgi:hypothetical protein